MIKRLSMLFSVLLIALALGFTSSLSAEELWDEGVWEDDDLSAFESDEWLEDDYGLYDEDFAWETDDEEFTNWYDEDDSWDDSWTSFEEGEEWYDVL